MNTEEQRRGHRNTQSEVENRFQGEEIGGRGSSQASEWRRVSRAEEPSEGWRLLGWWWWWWSGG